MRAQKEIRELSVRKVHGGIRALWGRRGIAVL